MKYLSALLAFLICGGLTVISIAAARLDSRLAWPAALVAAGAWLGLWGFP